MELTRSHDNQSPHVGRGVSWTHIIQNILSPKKNCLFPVMGRKNRVDRKIKKFIFLFIFVFKKCMFYVYWELYGGGGGETLRSGFFLSKNFLGSGHRKQTSFLGLTRNVQWKDSLWLAETFLIQFGSHSYLGLTLLDNPSWGIYIDIALISLS